MQGWKSKVLCLLVLCSWCSHAAGTDDTYWVDANNGDDANNGLTTANAYASLTKAIESADSGDIINVIGQSNDPTYYYPLDYGSDTYFALNEGVEIHGGYGINGNPYGYECILSGDDPNVQGAEAVPAVPEAWSEFNDTWWNHEDDGWDDNSVHVVQATDTSIDNGTVLDGFIIEYGKGELGYDIARGGGGMLIQDCSPLIQNCVSPTAYRVPAV